MYKYLIYDQLRKARSANKNFHVPGHKDKGDFRKKFPVADIDVTELSYSDNLASPSGIIAQAQRDIARILGARKSYIVTDGSTSGVMSIIYAAAKGYKKLIVPRNSHASVWNACRILGLEPVVVQGEIKNGVMLPPSPEGLERLIENDVGIAGIIVTSPDYYGNFAPLEKYAAVMHKYSRALLVDGAHGAHLAFGKSKQGYAGLFADMWVDGAHKCLPALTQGAIVSVNKDRFVSDLEEALGIFRTTSPSYPVMASVEYGVKYLANNPSAAESAAAAAAQFKEKFSEIKTYPSDDWTKLAVDFAPYGISADLAAAELEKRKIYCEFSDGRYVLFYLSPMTGEKELFALGKAIMKVISNKKIRGTYSPRPVIQFAPRTYSFQYALKSRTERVPLEDAAGRMCAGNAGLAPPCVPLVVAGEIISDAAVSVLSSAKNTFGLSDGKITVVKK